MTNTETLAWALVGLVFLGIGIAMIMSWRAIWKGEVPPLEPDNSIIHGIGDWAKHD